MSKTSAAEKKAERERFGRMTESELMELRVVLMREMQVLQSERSRKAGTVARITAEIRQRKINAGPDRIVITDHAVVRYLERIDGMDIEAVRQKVLDMARRAKRADSEFLDDEESGFRIVKRDGSESVATIIRKTDAA